MSNTAALDNSFDVNTQSATEIMIQMFEDLRFNRLKAMEDRDLDS